MTPILLSMRGAARLLGCRRETVAALVKRGVLRAVPWFNAWRIPLAEVERLAAEGVTPAGRRPRARRQGVTPAGRRPRARRQGVKAPPPGVGARIAAIDLGDL